MLRISGGRLRGRRIAAPRGSGTRPTADKVRQAVFNVLQSHLTLDGCTVVDLYAGSGALGIEALSRGAVQAVFVEGDARTADALRATLQALDLGPPQALVVRQRVLTWLAGQPPERPTQLILADPPYASAELEQLLPALAAWPGAAPGAVLVIEAPARATDLAARGLDRHSTEPVFTPPANLEVLQVKRYGDTQIVFLIKGNAPPG